jgi:hypothetical protein
MDSDIRDTAKCDISGAQMLMRAQISREFELAHSHRINVLEQRIRLLRGTITGFATNGTSCLACEMSNQCAREAIERDDRFK